MRFIAGSIGLEIGASKVFRGAGVNVLWGYGGVFGEQSPTPNCGGLSPYGPTCLSHSPVPLKRVVLGQISNQDHQRGHIDAHCQVLPGVGLVAEVGV